MFTISNLRNTVEQLATELLGHTLANKKFTVGMQERGKSLPKEPANLALYISDGDVNSNGLQLNFIRINFELEFYKHYIETLNYDVMLSLQDKILIESLNFINVLIERLNSQCEVLFAQSNTSFKIDFNPEADNDITVRYQLYYDTTL